MNIDMSKLSPMFRKNNSTMRDPRRTGIMKSTCSNRTGTWWRVVEIVEFDGEFYLLRDWVVPNVMGSPEILSSKPISRSEAVKAAKAHALETGNPYVPGLFYGHYGAPLIH
jgi:hypothetical protein